MLRLSRLAVRSPDWTGSPNITDTACPLRESAAGQQLEVVSDSAQNPGRTLSRRGNVVAVQLTRSFKETQLSTGESEPIAEKIKITAPESDSDGFVTIWNVAATSCGDDQAATRELAAKLLLFLCKKKCDFVVTSSTNAEYLDSWFERDSKLLYDWKPGSEFVDVVAQHAEVPTAGFLLFLKNNKFDPDANYTATRAVRLDWFREMWCIG